MMNWANIRYLGFWDVPRIFLVRHRARLYLFCSPFNEEIDDYSDDYQVFLMPEMRDEELPKDWTTLPEKALAHCGSLPISRVTFDPTRRQQIDASIIDELTPAMSRASG